MRKSLFSLGLVSTLMFTGCVTTPSQPLTFDQLGNYSATPLNSQIYRISFQATAQMNFGTAEEITLLKAAQTTVQKGFQFFKVQDDPSNRAQKPPRQAVVYSAPMFPYGYYRRHPAFYDPFYDTPQVVNIDPILVSYTIHCFKNQKEAPSDAFDARLILQSLGAKYGLNPAGEIIPAPVTPEKTK